MNRRQAIIDRLRALIEARKAQVRVRIQDRALVAYAAGVRVLLCVAALLLCQTANARTVSRSSVVRFKGKLIITNNPVIVQAGRG